MSTSTDIEDNTPELSFSIKVLHISNEDTSKTFGEIMKTKSSSSLVEALKDDQMYVNQMHNKLDQRVSNITHHLNKLIELGVVNIEEKPINKKTKPHRHFDITIDGFLVLIKKEEGVEEVHKYKILKNMFKDKVKFSSVIIAGVATWFSTNILNSTNPARYTDELTLPILLTGIVVIGLGLFVIYYSKKRK